MSTFVDLFPARKPRPRASAATRTDTAVWKTFGVMGILLLAYLGLLISGSVSEGSGPTPWLVAAFELVGSALCVTRAFVRQHGRLVPLALGAGLFSWSLGDLVLAIESSGGTTPAVPSLADAFYLGFFPLAYIAVVLFMRGEVRRLNSPSWLDSAVAALGAAAVCAAFAFHGLMGSTDGNTLAVATNLAYPVGDLLLLGLVVGSTAMLAGRSRVPWLLMATGMTVNVAGDTFNLFGSSVGASHFGAVVNEIAWPVSILMMAMAVWVRPGYSDPLARQRTPGFLLPGLATGAALVILVSATLQHTGGVAIALATSTLVVVGIRLALSVRGLRMLNEQRHRMSVTDHLTGLGNRRHLFDVLEAFFAEAVDSSLGRRDLSFLFIDLDRFKEINDSFGHPAGDELLRQLGSRLSALLAGSGTLVRIGGDEFAAILLDADSAAAIEAARQITESLQEPFGLDAGVSVRIGVSIGVARAPADASHADALLSCADVAMYRAKVSGAPFALYQAEVDDGGNLLRLAEELQTALTEDALVLHYQPQLDLRSGEITGVEALLRWPHPRLGWIPPLKFLPLAEQAGLMGPLTRWVLDRALGQCATWRAAGSSLSVSVNVSATNFLDDELAQVVQELLKRHQLPPNALTLEITETTIISEFERTSVMVKELSELGVVVSIDDFGTGFTSLAYLSSLSVGELKLDRKFIGRFAGGKRDRDVQLVRATIELGHALELHVIAEGIEDRATLELLRELGCDSAQGYFVGRPELPERVAIERQDRSHDEDPCTQGPAATPARRVRATLHA